MGESLPMDHTSIPEPLENVSLTDNPLVYAIFDGMGGESAGEMASFISAESFKKHYNPAMISVDGIKKILCDINQEVVMTAAEQRYNQIGSTAVILYMVKNKFIIADLGDSPCYLFRSNQLQRITVPHTNEKYLLMQNIKRRKPALTQFLGIATEDMILEPFAAEGTLRTGDVFLMCSDGLTDMVTQDEIINVLMQMQKPEDGMRSLLEKALKNGGRDNITIIICMIKKKRMNILHNLVARH
jgi:protein phosphatase